MIILRNPQIAELIEAGCAFKSDVIISKNETKKIEEKGGKHKKTRRFFKAFTRNTKWRRSRVIHFGQGSFCDYCAWRVVTIAIVLVFPKMSM